MVWLVAAVSGSGAVLNLASPSMWERVIWVPVSLATCVLAVLVARARTVDQCTSRPLSPRGAPVETAAS